MTTPTTSGPARDGTASRYVAPNRFDRFFNPLATRLARWGVSLKGSRLLEVEGRRSGIARTVPVNPLTLDGQRYLVAPRGHTQWVRNLRVTGHGRLLLGRRAESFVATELADVDKPPVLRAYLRAWAWEVGRFFDDLTATSSDEELLAAAADFPVFRIESEA